VGLINDIHLDLAYESTCSLLCKNKGFYGEDPPLKLLESAVKDMGKKFKEEEAFDLIIVTGDLVVHGLASSDPATENWEEMKETIETIMSTLKEGYPETPILGAVGNNDVKFHYQAAEDADKASYYGDLFEIWFTDVPANSELEGLDDIESTFLQGGYYRYDFSEELAFLSINSVILNTLNAADLDEGATMLSWMETQFSSSPSTKFVLFMHIFPGMIYATSLLEFWQEAFLESYLDILDTYQHQIIANLGSHIHSNEIRAPSSSTHPDVQLTQLATSALSPKDYNNPSYTVIDLSAEEGIQDVQWRSLLLYEFIVFRITVFNTIKPLKRFDIDLNEAGEIESLVEGLQGKLAEFTKYMGTKLGYPWLLTNLVAFFLDIFFRSKVQNLQLHYVCAMKFYQLQDYEDCVE